MRERPGKVALLITSLAIGVAVVVSLYTVSQVMYLDLQNKIDEYGANMVMVPKTETLPLAYAGVTVGGLEYTSATLTEADLRKIRTIKNSVNIRVVAPKLLGVVPVEGQKAMVAGVRFSDEFKLKKWWELKKGARPARAGEALLGGKAARALKLDTGDTVEIAGKRFMVSGILAQVGTQEDELVYIELAQAQALLNRLGEVSLVEVAAWCKDCPIDDIVEQIKWAVPAAKVSAVRQAHMARESVIEQFRLFAVILSVTMIAVAALIVFTNNLSAVRERRREIGVFRAVGYRQSHVLYIVLLEAAVASLVAGLAGYLVGFAGAGAVAPLAAGIDVAVEFNPAMLGAAVGGVVALALLASIYPAAVAARLDPADALQSM